MSCKLHQLLLFSFSVLETKTETLGPGVTSYKIRDLLYGRTYIFTIRPLYGEVEGPISTVYQKICKTSLKWLNHCSACDSMIIDCTWYMYGHFPFFLYSYYWVTALLFVALKKKQCCCVKDVYALCCRDFYRCHHDKHTSPSYLVVTLYTHKRK